VGSRGEVVAAKTANQAEPFGLCRFIPVLRFAFPYSPGRWRDRCWVLLIGQGDHLEIRRAETEFLHEFVKAMLGQWRDQYIDGKTELNHDLRGIGDSFGGYGYIADRIQDLAKPEDKSQIPIDNEDSFQSRSTQCATMQFTRHR